MSKKKKTIAPLPILGPDIYVVDTHCHLDMDHYADDCDMVVNRALESGVSILITIGIDLESSQYAIRLAEKYPEIYATVGVHPHNVGNLKDDDYKQLRKLATHPRVVGYGEIGIDLVKEYAPVALQELHFRKQLMLAKELELPVIIHDREAHDLVIEALHDLAPFPAGGIMHCFSGDATFAMEVINLGFMISIPGVVTFNKANILQEAVKKIPLESLLLETDAPFLAPVPRRGKRNEPLYTLYTAQKVADLKQISIDEVAKQTTRNAMSILRLNDKNI